MSASILVVDDEPDVANLFRQSFRREARQGTYVMHFAASGQEAFDRLAAEILPTLVFRSNQMIHSLRVRPRQAAAPRGVGGESCV
jgi:CheY-like chemotaxis protein